jgi:superfamily II DNA or RNA helicase
VKAFSHITEPGPAFADPGAPRPGRLRDYQSDCLGTILDRYRAGVRRQLVCLPTGTGKTVIFASFPRFFRMRRRMLVLAHREELLEQAREKIVRANRELVVEIEQAGRTAGRASDVVVASVPTLGKRGSRRLARLDPDEFYLVVVDEAHHAVAATYRRVLEHFGLFAEGTRKLLVGFTATPKRGDGQGLDAVFQEITFSKGLPEMILAGYLSPVAGWRVETDVDLSGVRTRKGDFVSRQLSQAVNVKARNDLVVRVFRERLAERLTIAFCVDVAHAVSLAEAFCEAGVPSAEVTGDTPPEERRKALADFAAGRVRVLTNCMVLTEGYDEPAVAGIILARPTKSQLLYAQMIGRATRLHPGKPDALVVDVVDATREHRLVTLPSLFGLSEDFDLEGRTTSQVQEAIRWVEHNRPWVRTDLATSLSDLRYRCRRVNLVELELPEELYDVAEFAWAATGRGTYRLGLAGGEAVVVASTILGDWETVIAAKGRETEIGRARSLPEAIGRAELWVRKERKDSLGLVLLGTKWRSEPASDRQRKLLESKGITVPKRMTKGQASHLVAMLSKGRKRSSNGPATAP